MNRIFYVFLTSLLLVNFPASATKPTKGISDGEIAKALIIINEGEIDAAKIADEESQNRLVKDFAKTMQSAHELNKNETEEIIKKNDISPSNSPLAKSLKEDAKRFNKDLKKVEKVDFDKTYLDQQVQMHEKALNTLDGMLIPNAKDLDFKAHLERTRTAVAAHLEHTKNVRSKVQ